jgi:hypothetical protein
MEISNAGQGDGFREQKDDDAVFDQTALSRVKYSPPDCSMCAKLRPDNTSYVFVYHTKKDGEFVYHYCKCHACKNTFKDVRKI